jgi:hypothetical protein
MSSSRPRPAGVNGRALARGLIARRRSLATQFVLIVLAALCYFGVRGLTRSSRAAAEDNADELLAFEEAIGIDVEARLQEAIIEHDWLVTIANWIYIFGHWPVIAVTLGCLFVRAPGRFRLLRDAMFISGGVGLLIFALYPVSPPRFGILEVIDTVSDRSRAYRTLQPPGLINPYAAMPSLHFGWNLLVGVIVWSATRNRVLRGFALVMPALMAFAVVATANHYVVDVVAGGALALFGLLVASRLPDVVSDPFRRRV